MRTGKKRGVGAILVLLLLAVVTVFSVACKPADSGNDGQQDGGDPENAFCLYADGSASTIFVDGQEHKQVIRAAEDLKDDIYAVSGGEVALEQTSVPKNAENAVIIGTVGDSALIETLIANGKFDEAESIRGKWECYAIKVVEAPCEGVDRALVIAGSDKRGTIYGIYTISEKIGVSPWYWFADVTPEHKDTVTVDVDTIVSEEPSVKYRGIFINDEFNFTSWAKMYSNGTGSPNAEVYGHVFELLLRLKANTLWPGMHGVSTAFYADKDEDGISLNAKAADAYGIVIGTSHCEQCLRNNVGEWQNWVKAHSGEYGLPNVSGYSRYSEFAALYDFSLYPEAVSAYWYERLLEAKDYESLITIGMRGVHDEGFSYAGLQDKSFANRVALLQRVIDTQLAMIEEIYGEDYEEKVQLVYIPYKEAADYYYGTENGVDYGVKIKLPESTMLMWADDNYGGIRQTPDEDELIVKDGYGNMGIYYHISYVGVPCVYIWTDVTSYATIYEEMRKAYDTGANGYWIVNVGDIKPGEYGMEYFLQLAYDVDSYDDTGYRAYMTDRALRDFTDDPALAEDIADLSVSFKAAAETYKSDYAGKENMPKLSQIANGDEALRLLEQFEEFAAEGERIYNLLPEQKKDAFFETVYYAVRAQLYSMRRVIYAERTQLYFEQGRYLAAAEYGAAALEAQDALEADVRYYNNTLADGKWYGMMDEYIGGDYYGAITREELERMIIPVAEGYGTEGVGAVCEGQRTYEAGGTLSFTSLGNEERFIDVYSLGSKEYAYTVQKPSWLIMEYEGVVGAEERLVASVDWNAVTGSCTGTVVIEDSYGNRYKFAVSATVYEQPEEDCYVVLDGVASIEAERFTESIEGADGTYWDVVEGLGRSGSSVRAFPDTKQARTEDFDSAAKLVYTVYTDTAGQYTGTLYRIPTLNEGGSCDLAIGVGTRTPQIISGTYRTGQGSWSNIVMPRIEKLQFSIFLQKGYNEIVVYRVDPFIAFDKIVLTASGITDDSYYGIPETYNTFSYERAEVAPLPEIAHTGIPEDLELDEYLFDFGTGYVVNSVYTDVSVTNGVYDESKGFGFETEEQANSVTKVYREAKTAPRNAGFMYGEGNASWLVSLPNGRYGVAFVSGDFDKNGISVRSTVTVNGVSVMQDKAIPAGGVGEYYALVEVTDGVMRFDLSGTWILNAIEIYPYRETDLSGSGAFVVTRNGGYIEAEAALENSSDAYIRSATSNSREWTQTAGVSGSAMAVGPDAGISNTNTATLTGASLNYRLKFETGGTFYIWALVKTISADDDSFHVGWDGRYMGSFNPSKRKDGFTWVYSRVTVNVSAGDEHLLTIWQREDGIVIDKLYISPFYSSVSAGLPSSDQMPVNDIDQVREIPASAAKSFGKEEEV